MFKILRPDAKGRVTLGALAEGVSGFAVTVRSDHKIILEPYAEIPLREKWLFDNKIAMKKVSDGLEQLSKESLTSKGSFSQFTNDEH